VAPDRLFGIGMIPTYRIDAALRELEFCSARGMPGCMIWQTPHPDLPFSGDHYEPFWSAARERGMPVSLHIITGFNYSRALMTTSVKASEPVVTPSAGMGNPGVYYAVRQKLDCVIDALSDIVFSGVFERHPDLRLVLVENEVGWLPFMLDQWDYYARGKREADDPEVPPRDAWPSDLVGRNVFVTFFRDTTVRKVDGWGLTNWMWSNDYPHPNSTWPHSRDVVARLLDGLSADAVRNLVWQNAARLYGLDLTPLELS
jgi:predicted TIM-barrel fold metal-dependent hydrolase